MAVVAAEFLIFATSYSLNYIKNPLSSLRISSFITWHLREWQVAGFEILISANSIFRLSVPLTGLAIITRIWFI
jgi:hypothetical protein